MKNSHGLSRTIPNPTKREIRQKSGFGCVICGSGIIQYEHVDPEYHEAKKHESDKMTLLCPSCHHKVTTGFWSKDKVKLAMKNPKCLEQGFSNEVFDIGCNDPVIYFAGSEIKNCQIPIEIKGISVFSIKSPEGENKNYQLSGNFFNSKGIKTLTIIDNEWFSESNNWDAEVIGQTITIREKKREIALQLTTKPPNKIIVDKINMRIDNYVIKGDKDELSLYNAESSELLTTLSGIISSGSKVGFRFC